MQKILVIQTAFIGDVVLATGLLEKMHSHWPGATIDILVRKGNESLFAQHPFLSDVLTWDKKAAKYRNLFRVIGIVRKKKYDLVVNLQRFAATGLVTVLSGAKHTVGFDKNPFSFLFSERVKHVVNTDNRKLHEIHRNHLLIATHTDGVAAYPKLYPSDADRQFVAEWKRQPYICIAPASVWFTKQFPPGQWVRFINALPTGMHVYMIGARGDRELIEGIRAEVVHPFVLNLAGKLNFLQSAALLEDAVMNYVNDSAPMHFASAVDAPVTAVYCSTIPEFGFGPLSGRSHIVEITEPLTCRPCGLHGRNACPLEHFNCAWQIRTQQLLDCLSR